MTYLWSSTSQDVKKSNYISFLSFHYNKNTPFVRFRVLDEYIQSIKDKLSYKDIVLNRQITDLIVDVLDEFASIDDKTTSLSYNLISKEYARFIAFYSELLEGDELNSYARFKSLDDIFWEAKGDLISRFPELTELELNKLNDKVKILLGEKEHTKCHRILSAKLKDFDYNAIDWDKYRDSHLLESVCFIWYKNCISQDIDDVRNVVSLTLSPEELNDYLTKFPGDNVDRGGHVIDITEFSSEYKDAIKFFFESLNYAVVSLLEYKKNEEPSDELYLSKKRLFSKVWAVMQKEESLWMVPSETYVGLLS